MPENSNDASVEPDDFREVTRLFWLRTFEPLTLKRDQKVWCRESGEWEQVIVGRRLPGNVYWAKRVVPRPGYGSAIVHRGVFGGLVEE